MRKAAGSGGMWPEPDKQLPGKESWSLAAQRSVGRLSGRWICGMGQEGEQVGKIIAWQFQEEEVDRRVTGRINKDPETFNLECMGGVVQEGTCRATGWPLPQSERTGSGWGLRGGWAGRDREGCTVAVWREARALEMPRQHSLACISFLSSTQLRVRGDG